MTKILILSTLLGGFAFATSSNCPTATGTTLTTINGDTNGMTTGGGTISTSGCGATDQTFGNFTVTATGFSTNPAVGTTDGYVSTLSPPPETFDFTTTAATTIDAVTSGETATATEDVAFLTQLGTGANPSKVTADEELGFTVDNISLAGSHTFSGTTYDTSITITIYVCEGATSAPTGSFTTCTGVGNPGGTLVTSTVTVTNTGTGTDTISSLPIYVALTSGTYSDYAVNDVISITNNRTGSSSFQDYSDEFTTPEPSSFLLLGTALGILGFFVLRRKTA